MPMSDTAPEYQLNIKMARYPKGTYTLWFKVAGNPVVHTVMFMID